MKLHIVDYDYQDDPPVPGAVREPYLYYQTFHFEPRYLYGGEEAWYGAGTNHRTGRTEFNQTITRDLPREGWFIEVERVEDLQKLVEASDYKRISIEASETSLTSLAIILNESCCREDED